MEENLPQIGTENTLDILNKHLADKPASSWLWLGNAVTAATHYDNLDGINCIVAGRKRFTFFPPDQFPNLYVGPLDLAPGGQPTSLVKVSAPDLERYPRFAQALTAAETVDVEPGDAVFIPSFWWHNVESLEPLNLSMNYWWFEGPKGGAEPFAALAHGLLAITPLPPGDRELWRKMFDHYVRPDQRRPCPLPAARASRDVRSLVSRARRLYEGTIDQVAREAAPASPAGADYAVADAQAMMLPARGAAPASPLQYLQCRAMRLSANS